MKNWKTTASGSVAGVLVILALVQKFLNGEAITMEELTIAAAVFSNGLGLFHAKDATTPTTTISQPVAAVGPATIEKTL